MKSGSAEYPHNEYHGQSKRYKWHIANVSINSCYHHQCI